ncbi:uncharacterized protein BXZ73DRAFT_51194 [Epithele typhae]|uniref:uncharacterized protein n=1 Tax=Epithele typhae TaxID=378194 RepID=UPI00200814BF|nr:uncharacterized protein BXZ73DRAFT_51194 [Epithele typhae]KAH9922785.1 hypothetical protein BXZ73DRAFT_51194 [Epithele typhae]
MPLRRSGLQKDVLSLYRRALRMVSTKPEHAQSRFRTFVRYTFRTEATSVSPRDIGAIEFLLRRGRRQLELYENPKVTDCFVSPEMYEWDAQHPGRREHRT